MAVPSAYTMSNPDSVGMNVSFETLKVSEDVTSWILEFEYKPISISDNWTNILQLTGLDNIVSIWMKG